MHPEFSKENGYLTEVLKRLHHAFEAAIERKQTIDRDVDYSFKHYSSENVEQFNELTLNTEIQQSLALKLNQMQRVLKKPYFARVDFSPLDGKMEQYYIGKMSLTDENNRLWIVDWRAPVSNLYYEGRLGEAEYLAPEGIIRGEMSLKRQFIIEDGTLQNLFDIDITTNDEFLQMALGENKDNRLKDIVSTIQAEQNRVIRAKPQDALIVQGAAGGGKTTIALHRIAYLLYHYEKHLNPNNMLILAPSRFFLSYISEVLPELGVESVSQTTFYDFVCDTMDSQIQVKDESTKLNWLINNPHKSEPVIRASEIKASTKFMILLENFINQAVSGLFTDDFMLGEYVIYSVKRIQKLLIHDYSYLPMEKRIAEIKKYLINALKQKKPEIESEIHGIYDIKVNVIKQKLPDSEVRRELITEVFDARDEELRQFAKSPTTLVNNYFKSIKLLSVIQYYQLLFTDNNILKAGRGLYRREELALVKALTEKLVCQSNPSFESEDLTPLLYIHFLLYGKGSFDYRHIIIDEAQDVGPFTVAVLRKFMGGSEGFTILGDLYQGIYSHKGTKNWEEIAALFPKADYQTLETTYRTTVEVMDFANRAAKYLSDIPAPLAKPVIRHGSPVEIIESLDIRTITQKTAEFKQKGMKSVAIIAKTQAECDRLYDTFGKDAGFSLINGKISSYDGGAVIVPVYLAKGLEFDGVIIYDCSQERYPGTPLDAKLLYVAATRAIHELVVFYQGQLSEIVR